MVDMATYRPTATPESEIERRLDELIALMAENRAEPPDAAEYQELLASRARLMRPPPIISSYHSLRRRTA
jgi:hypothetical protein